MGALAARLSERPAPKRCKLGDILDAVDDEDRAALEAWGAEYKSDTRIRGRSYETSPVRLAKHLAEFGFRCSSHTIVRHYDGACACG